MVDTRAQQTREKILRAALEEFSELGPAGARIDRIASAAGVNKQRLYAYYTDKEGMFSAVLSRAFATWLRQYPSRPRWRACSAIPARCSTTTAKTPAWSDCWHGRGCTIAPNALETPYSRGDYYEDTMTALARSVGADIEQVARALLVIVGIASWPHIVPQQRRLFLARGSPESVRQLDCCAKPSWPAAALVPSLLLRNEPARPLPTN